LRSSVHELDLETDASNVALVLRPPVNLTGTLTGAANATVYLHSPDYLLGRSDVTAAVSQDGTFQFNRLQPDQYKLSVRPAPDDAYLRSVELDGTAVTERVADNRRDDDATAPAFAVPLDLRKISGSVALKIVLARGARLSGSVEGAAGRMTDGRTLVGLTLDGKKLWAGSLDAGVESDGQYVIHGVPPGKYRIFARHPVESGGYNDAQGFQRMLGNAELIELHEGDQVVKDLKVVKDDGDGKKDP
jgi:hypothetical protein